MRIEEFFGFRLSTDLSFGVGMAATVSEKIGSLGFSKVGIIIDKNVVENAQVKKLLFGFKDKPIQYSIFLNDSAEPTYDYLDNFRESLRDLDFDCLVGVGGGSTIDLTKGIAVLLRNEGKGIVYRGFPKLAHRPIPVVAVPTTAGSGSEVTFNAVFTDSKEKKRLGINSLYNFPIAAMIDPLIYVDSPQRVTVSSGADAIVHALESFVNKQQNYLSRSFSKESFRFLFNALPALLEHPEDLQLRAQAALGAYMAGVALMNSGSGPSGAFSYPLGAVYGVPHGYAGAVFLPSIVKFNVGKGYLDYADLYDLISGVDLTLSRAEKSIAFAEKIESFMDSIGVYRAVKNYNLTYSDVEFMTQQYDILQAAISQNPVDISKKETAEFMSRLI